MTMVYFWELATAAVAQWRGERRWTSRTMHWQGWSPDSFCTTYSVEGCRKDHSWGCRTRMAAKCRAEFSKVDYGHQTWRIKLYTMLAVKAYVNLLGYELFFKFLSSLCYVKLQFLYILNLYTNFIIMFLCDIKVLKIF